MSSYISKIEALKYPIRINNYDTKNGNKDFVAGVESVMEYIDELPPADVEPVKHGHWIFWRPRVRGRNATYKCSCCGKLRSSYYNDVQEWEYCPCGAKMEKGVVKR